MTFTATVSPILATGTVTFYDAGVSIGTGTISNGVATFTISTLASGSHSITASYGGDIDCLASSPSSPVGQVVHAQLAATAVNLTS